VSAVLEPRHGLKQVGEVETLPGLRFQAAVDVGWDAALAGMDDRVPPGIGILEMLDERTFGGEQIAAGGYAIGSMPRLEIDQVRAIIV
jgi:hypothetical protein